VLERLSSRSWDPAQSVLLSDELPPASAANTNQSAGTVDFASYAPKDIVLTCKVAAPAVLLYCDHFDPDWKVLVDGRPEKLLHCNFIMRGVSLTPGAHTVEFRFQPPYKLIYLTASATAVALLLLGAVMVASRRTSRPAPAA